MKKHIKIIVDCNSDVKEDRDISLLHPDQLDLDITDHIVAQTLSELAKFKGKNVKIAKVEVTLEEAE